MPYTSKSVAAVWLITLGLFVLTASGAVAGRWLLLLLPVALATPAFILRSQHPVGAIARPRQSPRIGSDGRVRSPSDLGGVDLSLWENEGGARRMHAGSALREPIHGTR